MTSVDTFVSAFGDLERAGLAGPAWLRELRRAAIARFAERGWPTTRDEEWKYTPLSPLTSTAFDLGLDGASPDPAEDALAALGVGSRLVFVDGRFSAKLSSMPPLPGRVRVESLGEALITDPEAARPWLAEAADGLDAFSALNTAFWQDGALVLIPDGTVVEEPIHLLFVSTARSRAEHPRSVIVLGRESRATVVEAYLGPDGGPSLTNAVAEIALGPAASLERYAVQIESLQAFHVARTRVTQDRDSRFTSTSVSLGARLARSDVHAVLAAEGAECRLHGLYVAGGRRHVDTHTVVDHAVPHTTSRQLYKGILDGRARGVFSGGVIVRPGANGTDAHQTNKNLLLSDEVEVDSKPQLAIFADDVKCSHGAADGPPPAEAIFYLASRGLGEAAARALLTQGFAGEILDRVGVAPLRAWLAERLTERLAGGRITEETS
jgi:Fe-S cluster assembly protein SufD